jgi:hypothetical protein
MSIKFLNILNFMGAVIAGLAVAAVGAGVSAYGASQNASATKDAAKLAAYLEGKFAKDQLGKLDELIAGKEEKLSGISSILDRFEGGAAFGDSDVLSDIRKAQSDFASLAAGDFTAFQGQLDSILSATLANTYGAGAADGVFSNLAADTIMGLRERGVGQALGIGSAISAESFNLLGAEFGIMDQEFDRQYMIGRNKLSAQTGAQMQAASQAGVGTAAAGQAITQIGSAITGAGGYFGNQNFQREMMQSANNLQTSGNTISSRPTYSMPSYTPSFSIPSISGGSTGAPSNYFDLPPPPPDFVPSTSTNLGDYWNSTGGAYGGAGITFGVLPPLGAI